MYVYANLSLRKILLHIQLRQWWWLLIIAMVSIICRRRGVLWCTKHVQANEPKIIIIWQFNVCEFNESCYIHQQQQHHQLSSSATRDVMCFIFSLIFLSHTLQMAVIITVITWKISIDTFWLRHSLCLCTSNDIEPSCVTFSYRGSMDEENEVWQIFATYCSPVATSETRDENVTAAFQLPVRRAKCWNMFST